MDWSIVEFLKGLARRRNWGHEKEKTLGESVTTNTDIPVTRRVMGPGRIHGHRLPAKICRALHPNQLLEVFSFLGYPLRSRFVMFMIYFSFVSS